MSLSFSSKLNFVICTTAIILTGLALGDDMRFWQAKNSQSCAQAAQNVANRFSTVTGQEAVVGSSREVNGATCEVSLSYRASSGSPRVVFNYDGMIIIEPKFKIFRFSSIATCEADRQQVEDFYLRGSQLKLISSGCYTHHDQQGASLVIAGGPVATQPMQVRDFSRIYLADIRGREEANYSAALRSMSLTSMIRGNAIYYFADKRTEARLATRQPAVDDEYIYVKWNDTPIPMLFLTNEECRHHGRSHTRSAFLAKIATEVLDERCITNTDTGKIQLKYILKLQERRNLAFTWAWQEIVDKSFARLDDCEQFLRVVVPNGICLYSTGLNEYAPYDWQE
jgi:hypothetical protein